MNSREWEKFDDDLDRLLEMTLSGDVENKMENMANLIMP